VRVLQGNGNLFWCGGMRLAFDAALKDDFAFYLWLNDDTLLESDAVARLLVTHQSLAAAGNERAIVVGSTRDPQTGELTYGGLVRSSRIHPLKYRLLKPGDKPIRCDTMNGNCVLIPRAVAAVVHNLSEEFRHGIGDFDYGLRARKAGCTVWIAPGYIGTCGWNDMTGGFLDPRSPLRKRWQHMKSDKGLPPGEYLTYARRHAGGLWPLFWALPYVRVVLGALLRVGASSRGITGRKEEMNEH
jgi:GT2 family glycosyltransferase